MAVQHETELYEPLKAFFEQRGYEIKGEVRHCDLVGVHPIESEPLIVEMKKNVQSRTAPAGDGTSSNQLAGLFGR